MLFEGDFLWLETGQKNRLSCQIGARVVQVEEDRIKVVDDTGQVNWLLVIIPLQASSNSLQSCVRVFMRTADLLEKAFIRTGGLYFMKNGRCEALFTS